MAVIILKEVRLGTFPALWSATDYENDKNFKYRSKLCLILNSENHKLLLKTQNEVGKEEFEKEWPRVLEKSNDDSKLRLLHDGDKSNYEAYHGFILLSATRRQADGKPLILDRKPKNEDGTTNTLNEESGKPYPGCVVNAKVDLWAQNNSHGKTVRANLVAMQFVRDADAFSNVVVASPEGFDELADTGEDSDLV